MHKIVYSGSLEEKVRVHYGGETWQQAVGIVAGGGS